MRSNYLPLKFRFSDIEKEFSAFFRGASAFLHPVCGGVIDGAVGDLQSIRVSNHFGTQRWEISENRCIVTSTSSGCYKRDGGGGHSVRGTLSFVWEIECIPRRNKKKRPEHFQLVGLASTKIIIEKQEDPAADDNWSVLAKWRFELGDANSPGCHFHVQVPWQDGNDLDVPRLPSIILTPTECLDYLLGELFQDDWPRHQLSQRSRLTIWAPIQRERMKVLLEKKAERLEQASDLSPWLDLKKWKLNDPALDFG